MRNYYLIVLMSFVGAALSIFGCSKQDKQDIAQVKGQATAIVNKAVNASGGLRKTTKEDAIKIVEALKNSKYDEALAIVEPKKMEFAKIACANAFASELASLRESKVSACVNDTMEGAKSFESTYPRTGAGSSTVGLNGQIFIPTGTYTYLESKEQKIDDVVYVAHYFRANYSDKNTAPIYARVEKTVSELILSIESNYNTSQPQQPNSIKTETRPDTYKYF